MDLKALMNSVSDSAKSFYARWEPWKLFEASDETFVLKASDRQERRELIATLSSQRYRQVWIAMVWFAIWMLSMIGRLSAIVVSAMALPLILTFLVLLHYDTSIKFLKLYDRRG
jgi:hypothetical protein